MMIFESKAGEDSQFFIRILGDFVDLQTFINFKKCSDNSRDLASSRTPVINSGQSMIFRASS